MDLTNRVALVTGSAHRVGKHIALSLAREGCDLVIHYHRSKDAAEETVAEIKSLHREAIAISADLRDMNQLLQMFDEIEQAYGRLDVLVNSSAIMEGIDLLEVDEEAWHRTLDLNLKAPFFCIQQAVRLMGKQGGGVIVNISDIIGRRPWVQFPVHSISKAGIEMLTQVASLALAPKIRINAVAPGPVLPPEGMAPERWEALGKRAPLQRSGTAEDVALAVIYLLKNDYVHGETLVVDGGMQHT
jgi:NAD(P)-dependent dehydrogenase (short-subunit alcohol dehydrogenase family)